MSSDKHSPVSSIISKFEANSRNSQRNKENQHDLSPMNKSESIASRSKQFQRRTSASEINLSKDDINVQEINDNKIEVLSDATLISPEQMKKLISHLKSLP